MTGKRKIEDKLPLVAIIGRPNVGKSTLFNRLVGHRKSIVHETSGITRDRIEGTVEWGRRQFILADLAGWQDKLDTPFENEIKEIIDDTFQRACLILLMVDGKAGIIPQDRILADKIRRLKKPVILIVNKTDNPEMENFAGEFHSLGFERTLNISAIHSRGINDLLDEIISSLQFSKDFEEEDRDAVISLAIVGRQNVGKSSLFNYLLGNKRSIVSPIPGTTRDSVDAFFRYDEKIYSIVDTAGLRKPSRVTESIEFYSSVRAKSSLQRAEISLFLVDVGEGIIDTDRKVGGIIQESNRAVIIVANKWDLTNDTMPNRKEFAKHAYRALHFLSYSPIVFTSAVKKCGIEELMEAIEKVHFNFNLRIQTSELNRILHDAFERRPPQSHKGKHGKLFYEHQVNIAPPTFQFFVNDPDLFHNNYKRYLEKQIRNVLGFDGAPLIIHYKKRPKSKGGRHKEEEILEDDNITDNSNRESSFDDDL